MLIAMGLDTASIIQLPGFPLPGNPHVGEIYDTCGQDFRPGGSRDLHLFGGGKSGQRKAEPRAGADVLDLQIEASFRHAMPRVIMILGYGA
jgi:hypothetical protein